MNNKKIRTTLLLTDEQDRKMRILMQKMGNNSTTSFISDILNNFFEKTSTEEDILKLKVGKINSRIDEIRNKITRLVSEEECLMKELEEIRGDGKKGIVSLQDIEGKDLV
jgi:hypothetical protein